MNQKIQELIKQAGTDCSGKWMGMNHAEKFAELIVRECMDVVDVGGEFVSRPKMVERLKEHFGVEL